MLTVVCERPGLLRAQDRPKPRRGRDEVLVRLKRIGVCGTDLHIFAGNQPYLSYPRVMGHELAGIAEDVPDGSPIEVGDTLYVVPYLSCGVCIACRQGKNNCCRTLEVLGVHRDGGMAEYLSVPQRFVHAARGVSVDEAAMVEFLAIGAHAVRRAAMRPGQRVLVVGAGPIGMAVALFARLRGAVLTILEARDDRLAFCRQHLGLPSVVGLGPDHADRLSAMTDGEFFDIVLDATGNAAAMEQGFQFVAHGGTYVLVSIVAAGITFSDPEFHKRELTLLGSRNATVEDFETVIAAIRAGSIPTAALNTHVLTLSEVPEKFPALADPGEKVVKAIVHV